jgi:hypothetical protein
VEEGPALLAQPARDMRATTVRQEKIRYLIIYVLLKLAPLARTIQACAPVERQVGYGVGVVVVVVFLTTTLVATILSPSIV